MTAHGYFTKDWPEKALLGDHPPVFFPDVLASGSIVEEGEVMGRVTASGKLVPLNPAGSDGSEVAATVSLKDVDASLADTKVQRLGHGVVLAPALVWPDGITDAQKTTAGNQLETAGIYVL